MRSRSGKSRAPSAAPSSDGRAKSRFTHGTSFRLLLEAAIEEADEEEFVYFQDQVAKRRGLRGRCACADSDPVFCMKKKLEAPEIGFTAEAAAALALPNPCRCQGCHGGPK